MLLYKFMSIKYEPVVKHGVVTEYKSNTLDSIANKYIYFSHFVNLNDSFEGRVMLGFEPFKNKNDTDFRKKMLINYFKQTRREAREMPDVEPVQLKNIPSKKEVMSWSAESVDKDIYRLMNDYSNALAETINQRRVACFSRRNSHELMWGHYADGMTGLCIEFEVPDGERGADAFVKVEYEDKIKEINFLDFFANQKSFLNSMHKYKSIAWEYEDEVRALYPKEKMVLFPKMFKMILVGFKCSLENIRGLISAVREGGITEKFKVAYPSTSGYEVIISNEVNSEQLLRAFEEVNKKEFTMLQAIEVLSKMLGAEE